MAVIEIRHVNRLNCHYKFLVMIKKTPYHSAVSSIYPSIYQPAFTKDLRSLKVHGSRPPVNVLEFPDYYEIEMPAPGFSKDDFLVKTQGCSLLIIGHKKTDKIQPGQYRHHGYHARYIARNVDLPANADTEFGTAEYKNGILSIYLYKTGYPVENHQNFIIVY